MHYVFLAALFAAATAMAQTRPAWVEKSDQNARLLLNLDAEFNPESAGSNGMTGVDEKIYLPAADLPERRRAAIAKVRAELRSRLEKETDPLVKQDLEILIGAADRSYRLSEAGEKYFLPDTGIALQIFSGMKGLLDDQIASERRPAALIRLKRYTGMEQGYMPTTVLQERWIRARMQTPGLFPPTRASLEKDLENLNTYATGIGLLFEKYRVPGYEEPLAKLRAQFADYADFLRKEILPKARTDFRLPPEMYRLMLEDSGADYSPADLERLAHQSFSEIQAQMQEIAAKVARQHGWKSSDYRDVIAELKKDQISGDDILDHYEGRLNEIEAIVRANHLVTLPNRPAIIKIASAAETAQQPAPHMDPPPLLNNHGERGAFVLPLATTGAGGAALQYDDFTYAAASWTLISHEARPGHELQFDAMVEKGVSLARALFAFNSTNVEGWGLYSEWFMLPYMPDEGKLVSLDFRLLRAARAFLDPELQEGKMTPDDAMKLLEKDVVCSPAFATEEVERFTFRMPGQAVSYFDGLTRLLEIRHAAQEALGPKFNVLKFHDFILSQGLLPPAVLRKAVMEDFVRQSQ